MADQQQQRWYELCENIEKETDPERALQLLDQLVSVLDLSSEAVDRMEPRE